MQAMLLPRTLPNNENIEVSAKYIPHHLIGGDYYDLIKLNEEEFLFCIADVSGKGVPAAILMSNFQASLRALASRTKSLTELVTELNKNIINSANKEKFITSFIGKYNCTTRILNFINAGHNPPLLLINNKFQSLNKGCTLLGIFETLPSITEGKISVPQNSSLICYTDGITEQTNNKGEEYGFDNLRDSILMNKNEKIETIIETIFSELTKYINKNHHLDDMALLGFRFR